MSKVFFLPDPTNADDDALQAFVDALTGSVSKHQGPGPHPGTGSPQSAHGGPDALVEQQGLFDRGEYYDETAHSWRDDLPGPGKWAVQRVEEAVGELGAWGVDGVNFPQTLADYATRADQSIAGIFDRATNEISIAMEGRWGKRSTYDMATTLLHELGHHYDFNKLDYGSAVDEGIETIWKTALGKLTNRPAYTSQEKGLGVAAFEALGYPLQAFKNYNARYGYAEARTFMGKETFAQLFRLRYSRPADIPKVEADLGLEPGFIEKTMGPLLVHAPEAHRGTYTMEEPTMAELILGKSDDVYAPEFVEGVLSGEIDVPHGMSIAERYRGWLIDVGGTTSDA